MPVHRNRAGADMGRICGNCSLPVNADDAFCGNCGRSAPASDATTGETAGRQQIPKPRSTGEPGQAAGGPYLSELMRDITPEGDQKGMEGGVAHVRSLSYTEVSGEPTYDPLANSRFLWQVVRQAALFVGVYFLAEIIIGVVCLFLGIAGMGFSSALNLWGIVGTLIWISLVILYWLQPIPALLAQHSRLLRLGAGTASTMLGDINQTIVRHATPYDTLRNRSMSPPGEGRRDYIELRRGVFSGIVSCFPHGEDLYVGWTFWIYLSPFRLMLMFIGRRFQGYTGRGNDMYQTLRYESTRATIAAIHSSVVEVAERAAPETGTATEAGQARSTDFPREPTIPARAQELPGQVRERSYADGDKEQGAER